MCRYHESTVTGWCFDIEFYQLQYGVSSEQSEVVIVSFITNAILDRHLISLAWCSGIVMRSIPVSVMTSW